MSEPTDETSGVRYGTRWGLMLAVAAPAFAAVAAVATAVASGALAVSFQAQGGTLRLTTSGLQAQGLVIALQSVPKGSGTGNVNDARVAVGVGHINGLCFTQPLSVFGVRFTAKVVGGDNDPSTYEITADNVVMDADAAQGQIYAYGHTQVNKNAASLQVPGSNLNVGGSPNRFGLQAESGVLKQVTAIVHDIQIPDVLTLPNVHVEIVAGDASCPAPPPPTK